MELLEFFSDEEKGIQEVEFAVDLSESVAGS